MSSAFASNQIEAHSLVRVKKQAFIPAKKARSWSKTMMGQHSLYHVDEDLMMKTLISKKQGRHSTNCYCKFPEKSKINKGTHYKMDKMEAYYGYCAGTQSEALRIIYNSLVES